MNFLHYFTFKPGENIYIPLGSIHRIENPGKKSVKIIEAQIETGQPYMLYKDAVNNKSNQKNIGVIKSSNLCAEIVEYSEKDETAVCNLASIALPKFVTEEGKYDYQDLYQVAKLATKNLDQVIDINFYQELWQLTSA